MIDERNIILIINFPVWFIEGIMVTLNHSHFFLAVGKRWWKLQFVIFCVDLHVFSSVFSSQGCHNKNTLCGDVTLFCQKKPFTLKHEKIKLQQRRQYWACSQRSNVTEETRIHLICVTFRVHPHFYFLQILWDCECPALSESQRPVPLLTGMRYKQWKLHSWIKLYFSRMRSVI